MPVRELRVADEPQLVRIAQLVHEQDVYPFYLPDSDYGGFLFGHDTLGARVAEEDNTVVGQVALHPRSSAPVMELAADSLGQPVDRLGVIARLLVHPDRRGVGAGAELLTRAAREAVALSLWPILDVVRDLVPAVRLYERQGWLRLGSVTVTFRDAVTIDEFVYVAPPALDRRSGSALFAGLAATGANNARVRRQEPPTLRRIRPRRRCPVRRR